MKSANWKKVRPTSVCNAMRLCKDYALAVHRRKVDTIAELMGETADNLYKWMANGRMPAILIPAFEHACGVDYLSRYLASTNHRIVIDIPRGRAPTETEVSDLQEASAECVRHLVRFYKGKALAEEVLDAIAHALRHLAWHQANVQKQTSPELPLFDTDVEQ